MQVTHWCGPCLPVCCNSSPLLLINVTLRHKISHFAHFGNFEMIISPETGVHIQRVLIGQTSSHTKLIGHLSSSQQNETDISHRWNHSKHKDGLNCYVSVHSHLSVIKHLTNSYLIKEHWRTNQLINQQTNNKPVKPFRKWSTMSDWLNDWTSQSFVLLLCRLCSHQTTFKLVKHLLKRRSSL